MTSSVAQSSELRRISLLREFKVRMLRPGAELLSPFADRVVSDHADISPTDLSGFHAEVRDNISQTIQSVHNKQQSQVILLSGAVGAGKSHIVRYFAQQQVAEQIGYVFVGGANHWSIKEFQPCLLNWMIQALTSPSPSSDSHLLLDRIKAIAFRAVGQLLENRTALRRCTARKRRTIFGRRRASYELIESLVKNRDIQLFHHLDFVKFSDEVCNRFLAEPSNLVHRYALRVLLSYVFQDENEHGVGIRERVLHWFLRKPDDGYWTRHLGVEDDLNKLYAVADAIKLLVHLFSPTLSHQLSTKDEKCRPLIFFFAFDQAEGRDELFESKNDWNDFFAHLSELYNSLPNVVVLFTMTTGLRNDLHPLMERQFKDRIRKDERFVLRQPKPEEILELYRSRLDAWLSDDHILRGIYRGLDDPYLPFGSERIIELGDRRTARDAIEQFDIAFHQAMKDRVIEPEFDFEFVLNDQIKAAENVSEFAFTNNHLATVRQLIEPLATLLANEYTGSKLNSISDVSASTVPGLLFEFVVPETPAHWVRIYLIRFGNVVHPHVPACRELLTNRQKARYSVWMVRANQFRSQNDKPEQMFDRQIPAETEARLQAALHLLANRASYEANGSWPEAWKLILGEIKNSYLGEFFTHARDRLIAIKSGILPTKRMREHNVMAHNPIQIELLNSLDRVSVNESVALQLVIRCPVEGKQVELRNIASLNTKVAEIEADLFERDLILQPGEVYRCTVYARFLAIGLYSEPLFLIQVGRDKETARPRIPTPPIRVVPSLINEIKIEHESICTYELGTKFEMTLTHRGTTTFENFHLALTPANAVRMGVSDHFRPEFKPGQEIKFTTVLNASELVLVMNASANGMQVGPVQVPVPVQPVRDVATAPMFRFLEPRKLTQADIKLRTMNDDSELLLPVSAVYTLYGGGTKYRVEIKPANSMAKNVHLRGLPGSVDVTEFPAENGVWAFQLVVLANHILTTSVTLHFDVETPDGPQQGELNLAIRPPSSKLWLVALTAGAAVTVKGVTGVIPVLFGSGESWESIGESITKLDNLWDLVQFLSIPVIRFVLWVADQVAYGILDE